VVAFFLGDDYLGVYNYEDPVDTRDLNLAMESEERACGITPVRNVFVDPLKVEYISLTCWPTYNGDYAFVPKISNLLIRLYQNVSQPSKHTGADIRACALAFRPSFRNLSFLNRFFSHHIASWPVVRPGRSFNSLRDANALSKLPDSSLDINWAYGFAYKYRLLLTALTLTCHLPLMHTFCATQLLMSFSGLSIWILTLDR
jgi:hypothetical protein